MARKPLSTWDKVKKEQFETELGTYSTKALKNIMHIADTAMDVRTKLNANIWLAEKTVGKDYKLNETEQDNNSQVINICLIPQGEVYTPNEADEKEIYDIENDIEDEDSESWEDWEEWGEDE